MKIEAIAAQIGGTVEGNAGLEIQGAAALTDAGPSDITFLANARYGKLVSQTHAGAIIVAMDWRASAPCAVIRVENPHRAFATVAQMFAPPPPKAPEGVHPSAVIGEGVSLGAGVAIGPLCVVERGSSIGRGTILWGSCHIGQDCTIGEDCRFYPFSSVRERVVIGDRVSIHNGSVIGSDGFGYSPTPDGWVKIPQTGTVVIENDVEIGANVTVDRARFGRTIIRQGAKIDNLVQVAHNVEIGPHCALAAQVGIAGSTRVGTGVQMGGQAGVSGHLSLGDRAIIGAQAGVTKDVAGGEFVSGYPAMPHARATKLQAHVGLLPDMRRKLADMEKRLASLESQVEPPGVPPGAEV